eukprot:TRINITY_DN7193_c0_g1_i2.p2 TRINITY_DN7193_c0_g1~~TRINITY_DN7193_c0_g1_i2.p2  ORF type:complete len:336 (+),score=38.46 TRINITY_DN7193_c0_g1_i2:42-1049(+)
MSVDVTFQVFGLFTWPLVAAVCLLEWAFAFRPPLTLGKLLLSRLHVLANASQRILAYIGLSEYAIEGRLHALASLPMAVGMVLAILCLKHGIARLVKSRLPQDDAALKFAECFVRATYYMLGFLICSAIVADVEYWPDTLECWKDVFTTQTRSQDEEAYYILELAYYTGGIFVHIFIDKPLNDFYVMLLHHVVTVCLILFSYLAGYHRIGILVLLCHDVSDVFLDYAKCLHYLDYDILSTVTFVNLLATWAYYRLYVYPSKVIYSTAVETIQLLGYENCDYYWVFNIWLSTLVVLHVYWFSLLVKIAVRKLTQQELADIREQPSDRRRKVSSKEE